MQGGEDSCELFLRGGRGALRRGGGLLPPQPPCSQASLACRNGTLLAVSTYYIDHHYNGKSIGTIHNEGSREVFFFDGKRTALHRRRAPCPARPPLPCGCRMHPCRACQTVCPQQLRPGQPTARATNPSVLFRPPYPPRPSVLDGGNRIEFSQRRPVVDFKHEVGAFLGTRKCGAYRPHGMAFKTVTPAAPRP